MMRQFRGLPVGLSPLTRGFTLTGNLKMATKSGQTAATVVGTSLSGIGNGKGFVASKAGVVYTPSALANWTALQLLRHVSHKPVLRILDPACGDGELLAAVVRQYGQVVEVCGRDIDPTAVAAAGQAVKAPVDLAVGDSLRGNSLETLAWQPDAVIMNPPWNGLDAVSRRELRAAGYELAYGQFDLYEVFAERVLKLFPDIPMAFILPDSVFLPEHTRFRRFLLDNTQLLFLARLGEGIFPGIYRGTVVVVLRNRPSNAGLVECFRLRASERRAFLDGLISLDELRRSHSHSVPLRRFVANPNAEFTLEVRSGESAIDRMIQASGMDWDQIFQIGRGAEVGKHGLRLHCPTCGTYRPVPRRQSIARVTCPRCGAAFSADAQATRVVRALDSTGSADWKPVIVGEDVDRYRCEPSRELQVGLPGVQYKDLNLALSPKLLVRKTGVGLRAAVDRSGSLTTQTVYHFVARDGVPPLVLDYVAGVLNSRVMLAFHLRWSGDLEWRSHPYVTPTVIKSLPVPPPLAPTGEFSDLAAEIATLAQRRSNGERVEEQIEGCVADLYGLTVRERKWVAEVLESAQALSGIAELRLPSNTV